MIEDINKIIELIENQTGLKITLCDYFTGLNYYNDKKYFNIILIKKVSESIEYDILERFANKYKLISICQNGIKRVSIFF